MKTFSKSDWVESETASLKTSRKLSEKMKCKKVRIRPIRTQDIQRQTGDSLNRKASFFSAFTEDEDDGC